MADVVINIIGIDKASPQLRRIGDAARKAARDLQQAGTQGKKGMQDIEQGAKKADQALRTFERTSLATGAALGATALGVIRVSEAYKNQERQIDAIKRLYGEVSDQALQYAETIQLTTRYSNDAARESLVLLNTLSNNFQFSQDQIETLLSRSTDLAQLHGRTLTEVTQMVSNALRGEGEYIEQIGVTLNQSFVAAEAAARGLENFSTSMTAAEQAAFRYTLLLEQTAAAQGYAMETATGTRGAIGLLINQFGDLTAGVGGAIGPVRDFAAEFSAYALWMPLIGSQIGRMFAILRNSTKDGQLAARSASLLGAALGPIGIISIAAGAGLAILTNRYLQNKQAAAQAAAEAEMAAKSYQTLNDSIAQMYIGGDVAGAEWAQNQVKYMHDVVNEFQAMVKLSEEQADGGWWDEFAEDVNSGFGNALNKISLDGSFGDRVGDFFQEAGRDFNEEALKALQIGDDEEAQIYDSINRLFNLTNNPNLDIDEFQRQSGEFFEQLWLDVLTGAVPPDQISEEIDAFYERVYKSLVRISDLGDDFDFAIQLDDLRIKGMDDVANDMEEFADIFDRLTKAREEYTELALSVNPDASLFGLERLDLTAGQADIVFKSLERIQDLMMSGDFDNPAINAALEDLARLFHLGLIDGETLAAAIGGPNGLARNMDQFALDTDSATESTSKLIKNLGDLKNIAPEAAASLKAIAEEQMDALKDNMQAYAEERQAMVRDFVESYLSAFEMDDPLSRLNLSSLRNEVTGLAEDIQRAASALDTVFRVAVGNTNAFAQQSQSVYDWAEALINVQGEYGKIDDLLANQRISQTEYNQAQTAFNDIARENAEIQEHVLTIQAKQAPLIRDHMALLENQLNLLADQDAHQQAITLGWMDSATAAQAYTLVTQAAQVATGELGASGEEAFHAMIEGAIAVNPFLFDMLESIGLINGTPLDFEVNLDGVANGVSEIERLTLSIDALTLALGGVPPDIPVDVSVSGDDKLDGLAQKLKEIEGGDREINVKVGMDLGSEGGPLEGLLGDLFGGGTPTLAPVTVPVIPSWQGDVANGDGTGGAGLESLPAMEVPVTPIVDTEDITAQIPTGTVPGPTVQFNYDISLLTGALASYAGVRVPGPVVEFGYDDADVGTTVVHWSSANRIIGPIVEFGAETDEPARALGEWVSKGTVRGPIIQFGIDTNTVSMARDHWAGYGATGGPIITFSSDDNAPARDLGYWVSVGSVSGPTVVFSANTSAVEGALARYSGTATIGTRYVDVVTRTSTVVGGLSKNRHGGIAGYAHGGMVGAWAGEGDNPEIAHFANGGKALLDREGAYALPPNTLITPSNAVRGSSLGDIHINIQTGDFYGGSRPDLDEWASTVLIPEQAEEFRRVLVSLGLAS